jgi:hypothetical protein
LEVLLTGMLALWPRRPRTVLSGPGCVEQLDAFGAADGLPDAGQLLEQGLFDSASAHLTAV